MTYAKNTVVSAMKSRHEIETLIMRYGADQFATGVGVTAATIGFRCKGRFLRFDLKMPARDEKRFTRNSYGYTQPATKQIALYEQEERRLWRALALVIKAKLESVESGIETFESAFAMNIVMPDGKLFKEHALPFIAESYETGKVQPLMLGMGDDQ